jgi:hypothetical protein
MTPVGHLAGAYLTTCFLLNRIDPKPTDRRSLLVAGIVAGILPDADTLFYVARSRSLEFGQDFDHHRWISHTFPPYWLAGLAAYLYGRLSGRRRLAHGAQVMTAATTVHLVQDTIGSGTGIMWAWPFSKHMGGIGTLHIKGGRAWLKAYKSHPLAWVERVIIVMAALTLLIQLWRMWQA